MIDSSCMLPPPASMHLVVNFETKKIHSDAMDIHSGAMESHSSAMEAHPESMADHHKGSILDARALLGIKRLL